MTKKHHVRYIIGRASPDAGRCVTIMPTSASAKTRLKPWSGSIDPKFLLFGRGPDFNATGNGHGAEPGWSGSPARRSTSPPRRSSSPVRRQTSRAAPRRASTASGRRPARDPWRGGHPWTDRPANAALARRRSWDVPSCESALISWEEYAYVKGPRAARPRTSDALFERSREDDGTAGTVVTAAAAPRRREWPFCASRSTDLNTHFMREKSGANALVALRTRQEPTPHVPDPEKSFAATGSPPKRLRFWQDQDTIAPIPLWPPTDERLPAVLYCTGDRSDADARVALVSVTKKAPTDQCAPVQLYDRNMTRARRLARRMLAGDA